MGQVVSNMTMFMNGLDKAEKRVEKLFRTRTKRLMTEAMKRMLARTPVHSGQAVMNYVASAGAPHSGPVKKGFKPVEATNQLPLGAERLRKRAEAVAMSTLAGLDFPTRFRPFISQTTHHKSKG